MAETKEKLEQSLTLAGRTIPDAVTQTHIFPLLEAQDLDVLTLTCKSYLTQYKVTRDNKKADKKVAAEMLRCVLNPNESNQDKFIVLLSTPKKDVLGPPLYLVRNNGEEIYFNTAVVKKTKTIRRNTNVLEAILRTHNFHYAKLLFQCIPENEKTQSLKRDIKEIKAQGIWGMPELQAAYKNFLDPWQTLYDAKNWDELDRLWGRIGQSLKEHLPWFSICLYCHPASHFKTDYTQAPNWVCVLRDEPLDLDLFGPHSTYALYKGTGMDVSWFPGARGRRQTSAIAHLDSAIFTTRSEVLSAELDKTIKLFALDDSKPVKEAAEVSAQQDNPEPEPEPKSLIQDKSVPNTTNVTGTFLETVDLGSFRRSAPFAAQACKVEMDKRKELSEGLLRHVFNADPKKVEEFIAQSPANTKKILDKTCFREGYHSKKLNKFVCFRHWKSVSSLQAAALCLDKFLVIKLLAHIVGDDNLRLEAKKQLEEIRSRIEKESKEQQEYVSSAAGEKKEAHEKTQNSSADLSEYGAPIKALLKAYSDYLTQYDLTQYPLLDSPERDELNKLWDVVGSCHKRLPRYVLQEIINNKPWTDDLEFSLEPPRGDLRDWNDELLDLDGLGDGSLRGLYKGGARVGGPERQGWWQWAKVDSGQISHLYELRIKDLGNIIDALATPEPDIGVRSNKAT